MLEVLVVEDDAPVRAMLSEAMRTLGHHATAAADGEEALELARNRPFDLVLCDVRLPNADGLEVMRHIRREAPTTDVILMTGYASAADAVAALREGAADFIVKPFQLEEVRTRVEDLAQRRALRRELSTPELPARVGLPELTGTSPAILRAKELIDSVAESEAPVLVVGESGTGKELVAQRLHQMGRRRDAPFVAINCAAFPEELLEAELFGHERGAFTGATRRRDGRFLAAEGGTLFLDEVAEMSMGAQVKLLRVLQEGTVERMGANDSITVDVRIVSATHRDLKKRIADGLFREDLYYRLRVLEITLPPLRERTGDLPVLVADALRRLQPNGQTPPLPTARAWAALASYPWPGNVRELRHALEHAFVLSRSRRGDEIDLCDLPDDVAVRGTPPRAELRTMRRLGDSMRDFERECLLRALELTGGRKGRAAELLGISRKALWKKLVSHGIGSGSGSGGTGTRH